MYPWTEAEATSEHGYCDFQLDEGAPHWRQVISLRTDHPWSVHSPDLSSLDCFLWGYPKGRVYKQPQNH